MTPSDPAGHLPRDALSHSHILFMLMFLAPLGERLGEGALDPGKTRFPAGRQLKWSRLSEQIFRVDKWSVCRG